MDGIRRRLFELIRISALGIIAVNGEALLDLDY